MTGRMTLVTLAAAAALGLLAAAAIAKDDIDNRGERGGSVTPCSLDGVNPAHHPEVFGNPAAAASQYGFIRSRDGTWRVQDNCQTRLQIQGLSAVNRH
jgi:hypothetical protein